MKGFLKVLFFLLLARVIINNIDITFLQNIQLKHLRFYYNLV